MTIDNLQEAFVHELKDVLYAEKQIAKALPKLAKQAKNEELQQAFEEHLEQTQNQIERLEQVFEALGKSPRAEKCPGILGIIEEGEELMKNDVDDNVVDALLIASAQRVEHYEIAAYGTLCAWGDLLGIEQVDLLKESLAEEKETDDRLTEIAESIVNAEAESGEMDEEHDASAEFDKGQGGREKAASSGRRTKRS